MQYVKPNLFIVGAAKGGTTAIHHYLSQHSDILMSSVKEPHYFSTVKTKNPAAYRKPQVGESFHTRIIKDELTYLSLFSSGADKKYRGEASPSYLYDAESARKIYDFNHDARIIIILREPVSRAISHYNMVYNLGLEDKESIRDAIEKDRQNPDKMWGAAHLYIELGLYHQQLERYFDLFAESQILVMKFEDFVKQPTAQIEKIIGFLELNINEVSQFEIEPVNQSKPLSNTFFRKWLFFIKNNSFLNILSSWVPNNLKSELKSYLPKDKGKNRSFDLETRLYINDTFFLEEKKILKEKYNISWDEQ